MIKSLDIFFNLIGFLLLPDVHFEKRKNTKSVLQRYYIAKENMKTARQLTSYLESTSEGLSAAIGQSSLYTDIKKYTQAAIMEETALDELRNELPEDVRNQPALDEMAKEEAVKRVCGRLQTDIELTHNTIHQRREDMSGISIIQNHSSLETLTMVVGLGPVSFTTKLLMARRLNTMT